MGRYNDRECAFCAADLDYKHHVIGPDYKVYCGARCAEAGTRLSAHESAQLNRHIVDRRMTYNPNQARENAGSPEILVKRPGGGKSSDMKTLLIAPNLVSLE